MRSLSSLLALLLMATATDLCHSATLTNAPAAKADARSTKPAIEWSFAEWKDACGKLPSNISLRGRLPRKELLPLSRFSQFDEVLTAFLSQCKTGALSRGTNWVGPQPGERTFFNTDTAYFLPSAKSASSPAIPFEPFAQKLAVSDASEIFFRADLHGDVRSLLTNLTWLNDKEYLRGFNIVRPDFYMIFLGDYTDRGAYGTEVLYTLLRLKLANPDRVFLARGNHEEVGLQSRYGFLQEGRAKYGAEFNARKLERAYDFLPVVIYAGTGEDFIQCNHGGMEPGFSPRDLLSATGPLSFQFLGTLNQKQFLTRHPDWLKDADAESRRTAGKFLSDFRPDDPVSPSVLGFMWNDFAVVPGEPGFAYDPKRAFIYGAGTTRFLLGHASTDTRRVHAVFRGHQQSPAINPMMRRLIASRGVFRHWQDSDSPALLNASITELSKILEHDELRAIPPGSVWTFNVSPDSVYGEGCEYHFDAFGILKLARNFADWRLRAVNVTVEP